MTPRSSALLTAVSILLLGLGLVLAPSALAEDSDSEATFTLHDALTIRRLPSGRGRLLANAFRDAPQDQLKALAFLLKYMPSPDHAQLDVGLLQENIEYACRVRQEVPWSETLNDELFYNYVLPYASLNERRDAWRKDFYDRFIEIAMDCETPGEAAIRLNREVFPEIEVRYHATRRQKPDQSPYESMEQGYASCTGLSILLVDACRAVGVPARIAGIPDWGGHSGNHTWTEVWDGCWRYTGSAEPANSLDVAWFSGRASKADASQPETSIYASSFLPTGTQFPMVWARHLDFVSAYDVTAFYTMRRNVTFQCGRDEAEGLRFSVYLGDQLVAEAPLAGSPAFFLAGNSSYQVTIRDADGTVLGQQTVQIGDEAEATVNLSVDTLTAAD